MDKYQEPFKFKQFEVWQDQCAMKVGTDGVLLGAWVAHEHPRHILDIGTGTGLIALQMAQRFAAAEVVAVEIDDAAAQQAQHNVSISPWADRITVHHGAIQDYVKSHDQAYDLIVSNPPFFSGGTLSQTQSKTQVRHTVKLPHHDLLSVARNKLLPEGNLAVILPMMEGYRFIELAATYNLYPHRSCEVFPDASKPVERLMLQLGKHEKAYETERLEIRDKEKSTYTEQYIALTKDFYAHDLSKTRSS